MPSTNFLKLWRPHQSSEISFKKLTNLFNKYLGLGFYLIHSQIPSTYHNASNIVDTHWIPIYWMNVESWKTKQYYELCLMHIRKSHGCLLANEEECRDCGLTSNKQKPKDRTVGGRCQLYILAHSFLWSPLRHQTTFPILQQKTSQGELH